MASIQEVEETVAAPLVTMKKANLWADQVCRIQKTFRKNTTVPPVLHRHPPPRVDEEWEVWKWDNRQQHKVPEVLPWDHLWDNRQWDSPQWENNRQWVNHQWDNHPWDRPEDNLPWVDNRRQQWEDNRQWDPEGNLRADNLQQWDNHHQWEDNHQWDLRVNLPWGAHLWVPPQWENPLLWAPLRAAPLPCAAAWAAPHPWVNNLLLQWGMNPQWEDVPRRHPDVPQETHHPDILNPEEPHPEIPNPLAPHPDIPREDDRPIPQERPPRDIPPDIPRDVPPEVPREIH